MKRPRWAQNDDLLRNYYDTEWGLEVRTERAIFERISLEAFQSGLSWRTILAKREAFREAFHNFDPDIVARFGPVERENLLNDARIVRNKRKIDATVNNAQATVRLRDEGGLAQFVWSYQPEHEPSYQSEDEIPSATEESRQLAQALKKHGFVFVGPTTAFALMQAIGIVNCRIQ